MLARKSQGLVMGKQAKDQKLANLGVAGGGGERVDVYKSLLIRGKMHWLYDTRFERYIISTNFFFLCTRLPRQCLVCLLVVSCVE